MGNEGLTQRVGTATHISIGNDTEVLRLGNIALKVSKYESEPEVDNRIYRYATLTNQAARFQPIIKDKFTMPEGNYKIRVKVIPVEVLGKTNQNRIVLGAEFIKGPTLELYLPSELYEKDFENALTQLSFDMARRLRKLKHQLTSPDEADSTAKIKQYYNNEFIDRVRNKYGGRISRRLGRIINRNPEIKIGPENTKLFMPDDKTIEVVITDLCLSLFD